LPHMTENAFEAIPGRTDSPLLLLCDHASSALPAGFGTLGLDPSLFSTHIAYDIGAASVTRALAAAYGAPALLGAWSGLLIDLNRGADDPTIVMKLSDGSIIPGNRDAGHEEVARRIAAYHTPYHAAIAHESQHMQASLLHARESAQAVVAGLRVGEDRNGLVIVSMHSFTPSWKGVPRRWEVGVLYDRDMRVAAPLMMRLAEA